MARKMTEWPSKRGADYQNHAIGWLHRGYSSLGGGKVVRFPRIWMVYGECRLIQHGCAAVRRPGRGRREHRNRSSERKRSFRPWNGVPSSASPTLRRGPTRCCLSAGNAICHALSSCAWWFWTEDFGTNLTLVEGNGGVRLSPVSVPEHAPRDWRSQCERERARADAAEARAEELRWAEVAARSDGGSWKSRFKACRRRLSEAVEETKEARRTARDVPSLQAEVARLETLLSEAGIASAFDTAGALRKENARLRKALAASKAREGATGPWPAPPRRRTVPGAFPGPEGDRQVRFARNSAGSTRRWSGGTRRTPG